MAWWWPTQLDRIEDLLAGVDAKVDLVLKLERRILADEQALDEALTELGTAVDAIVAKVSASDVDLSDEIETVRGISQKIGDALQAPAPPVEEPPAEGTPA